MDAAVQLRKTLQPTFEAAGTRLTFMPIFIKAASMALSKHPVINSGPSRANPTPPALCGAHS